jgi:hypothetical protein
MNKYKNKLGVFKLFNIVMPEFCRKMGYSFKLVGEEDDQLDFEVDNILFSLVHLITETETQRPERSTLIKKFQLYIWHKTMGGRYCPPESVDTLILEDHNIYNIMRESILCVIKNEMDGCMEMIFYANPQEVEEVGNEEKS